MYWQCTDESLSPRRKQNHTTKFFTEVTQFYSFILSRRCLRRSGQSRREKNNKICVKIEFYFFSISSKNNVGGSVNHKIKKVWPKIWTSVGPPPPSTREPSHGLRDREGLFPHFQTVQDMFRSICGTKLLVAKFVICGLLCSNSLLLLTLSAPVSLSVCKFLHYPSKLVVW